MSISPEDRVLRARMQLLSNHVWITEGILKLQMMVHNALPFDAPMATDGRHMFYNPEKIAGVTDSLLKLMVAHEVTHCFKGDEIIPGDYRRIDNILGGDLVVGESGLEQPVVGSMHRDFDGELTGIKAMGMLPIIATAEHPVCTTRFRWKTIGPSRGPGRNNVRMFEDPIWKPISEVEIGDWLMIPRTHGVWYEHTISLGKVGNTWSIKKQIRDGVPFDEETAWLFGLYLAEGCPAGKEELVICLSEDEKSLAEKASSILSQRFGYSTRIYPTTKGKGIFLKWSSPVLVRWFKRWFGSGAKNKRIPEFVLKCADDSIVKSFLNGYMAGDGLGTVTPGFGTASKMLAMQLQLLIARFGELVPICVDERPDLVIRDSIVKGGIFYRVGMNSRVKSLMGLPVGAIRSTRYYGFNEQFIYAPVKKIWKERYKGKVHNIETPDNTYLVSNAIVHNCLLGHMWRRGRRDPEMWNGAADMVSNQLLKQAGIGEDSNLLYPESGMEDIYVEKLYDYLKNKSKKQGKRKLLTPHDMWPDQGDVDPLSQEDMKRLESEWRSIMSRAYGKFPAGVSIRGEYMSTVRIPWYNELFMYLKDSVPYDFSSKRFRRIATVGGAYYLPRLCSPFLRLAVAYDSSGSMGKDQIKRALTETLGIVKSFDNYEILLMACDAHLHDTWVLHPGDELPRVIHGGGGTDFRPVFREIDSRNFQPDCLVYFTDTWGEYPSHAPTYPVVWAVVGVGEQPVPWGKTLEVLLDD